MKIAAALLRNSWNVWWSVRRTCILS